jgi:hypothetical protein
MVFSGLMERARSFVRAGVGCVVTENASSIRMSDVPSGVVGANVVPVFPERSGRLFVFGIP